jgi:hypothetical protein
MAQLRAAQAEDITAIVAFGPHSPDSLSATASKITIYCSSTNGT